MPHRARRHERRARQAGRCRERVVPISSPSIPSAIPRKSGRTMSPNFHPRMVGLTGTPEQIAQVRKTLSRVLSEASGATAGTI